MQTDRQKTDRILDTPTVGASTALPSHMGRPVGPDQIFASIMTFLIIVGIAMIMASSMFFTCLGAISKAIETDYE